MDKVIVASVRGFLCVLTLASLAACGSGGDQDSSAPTPAAQQPQSAAPVANTPVTPPSQPSQPSQPSSPPAQPSTPDNPPAVEEPTEPSQNADAAPQIGGSPAAEVAVGQAFSFTPSATDADGDSLSFSIQSKPSWASFDASTGRIWGTPTNADVGSHEDITITVSDGAESDTLPAFAINVVQQSDGSASLAWTPPTENTDGSTLTNLKGYKIHYGTESGQYDHVVTLNNAGLTSYVIENLAPGTYYFAVSAITSSDAESDMSGEASKTI